MSANENANTPQGSTAGPLGQPPVHPSHAEEKTTNPNEGAQPSQRAVSGESSTPAEEEDPARTGSSSTSRRPAGSGGPLMKPITAAKKLGVYLPATPEDFQSAGLTHEQFVQLQQDPPEWLEELRRHGPHPRPEVARKLGVTITALKKNGMDKPFTTEEIKELLANQPEWLSAARQSLAAERDGAPSTGEGGEATREATGEASDPTE